MKITIIEINGKKVEIQNEVSKERVIFQDIKIPKGWRLMTLQEGAYCYDNHEEMKIGYYNEWIKHYSKKMKKQGFCASLGGDWDFDRRLRVDGSRGGDGGGLGFRVRFARDVKDG